ncbi:hypothetical protein F4680DRAFT_276179 [Xylaria scruposa]|nr:hypothetical protein F4680DRAFT_276179 [Xylaria scruposa]
MRENSLFKDHHLLSITEEGLLCYWCEVVQAYSRTGLTKPRDRLIALAGAVQLMPLLNDSTRIHALQGIRRRTIQSSICHSC